MRENKVVPPCLLDGWKDPAKVNMDRLRAFENQTEYNYVASVFNPLSDQAPTVEKYAKLTKAVLLSHVPQRKKIYVVDEMAKAAGVTICRLPPYHCVFNPIELVWGYAKGQVALRNVEYKLQAAMDIMREATLSRKRREWVDCVEHVMEKEKEYIAADTFLEHMIDKEINRTIDQDTGTHEDDLIICLSDSDEYETDDSDDNNEDDAELDS